MTGGNIISFLSYNNINLDQAYEIFKTSYDKSTGASWSKDKFIQRASHWKFYGDQDGYVAVRPQRSGMMKLNGVAGNPKSIVKGLKELLAENHPTWGMVSQDMLPMAHKIGFITPPAFVIKSLVKSIPASVFGADFDVNGDGSITLHYHDVGPSTKYFIANKQYFKQLLPRVSSSSTDNVTKYVVKTLEMITKG